MAFQFKGDLGNAVYTTICNTTYARHIGRVGALAAALGIGMAVITSPGTAWADSSESSSSAAGDASDASDASDTDTTDTDTADTAGTATSESASTPPSSTGSESTTSGNTSTSTTSGTSPSSGSTSRTDEVAPGVTVSSSGGAQTDTTEPNTAATPGTPAPPIPEAPAPATNDEEPAETDSGSVDTEIEQAEPSASAPGSRGADSTGSTTVAAASSAPSSSVGAAKVTAAAAQPSSTRAAESSALRTAEASNIDTSANTLLASSVAEATAPVTPTAQTVTPAVGFVGFLNAVVTNLLNPFLSPAPNTGEPFTPIAWAVLGWVRRNLFNQSPTITYNPTTTLQTGQTVTGKIGATDPEGDALTYKVTQAPQHGTLTIDQATGTFTYTPDDINYTAAQTDSFTVSATDGKLNLLSLFSPRGDRERIGLTVLNPTVERVILDLPAGYTDPDNPRFAADGESLYFSVTPPGGTRMEVHQINVDGTDLRCVTCGLSPDITANLTRVVPAPDGRIMIQVETAPNSYVVYEPVSSQLVPVITPPAAARVLDPQREMRISPDGKYVVFSQIQIGQTGNFTAVPVVGKLVRTTNTVTGAPEYHIEDARVVYPVGEAKQWTPDGKGVIIIAGQYEAGNVDNIVVDLATGEVTRLNGSLDYDEDIDMSPNGQWIAVGSMRTYDALTPMSRIVRPPFLPAQIQGAVYEAYRGTGNSTNVSNQEWLVAIEDDLKGENGIPLFADDDPSTPEDEGDNYNARSMASWNADGTAVAFWEALAAPLGSPNPEVSRLVIANLKYTTSVGTVEGDLVTPHPTWAPKLSESVPTTVALPPVGSYAGAGGGTATITEVTDPTNPAATVRTVTYDNYVNVDGLILNGTESTSATASQNSISYRADITVTGTQTGYLRGDVTINKLTRTITPTIAGDNTAENPGSMIRSSLDGDLLVLLDPERIAETRTNA